jgi:hypothetical protein
MTFNDDIPQTFNLFFFKFYSANVANLYDTSSGENPIQKKIKINFLTLPDCH